MGTATRRLAICFGGGALLGLGSLGALWIALPYALACCAFVLVQTTLVRAREPQPLALRRSVLVGVLGFVCAGLLHVLLPRIFPGSPLLGWLGPIGLRGPSDPVASQVTEPLWFYPSQLYRDHFHLVPLILLGLPALLRRTRVHAVIALAMAFAACVGLIVLSVPAVKDPLHVLGVVPFLYLLAGTSLAELEADAPKYRPANAATVQAVVIVTVLSVVAVWGALLGGGVGLRFSVVYTLGMLGVVAIGATWLTRKQLTLPLLAACALAFTAFAAGL